MTVSLICFLAETSSQAAAYSASSHASASYGVSRPDMTAVGYAKGNCGHCHEQHASVGGSELASLTGAQDSLVFEESNISQSANFCFNCHGNGGTAYQTGGFITNRSYSYRAGGYSDAIFNIEQAFDDIVQGSTHNLADVVTFSAGKVWNFTSGSNGCAVCHDPHVVQGDPANASNSPKSWDRRGYLITRPSQHPTTDPWGDDAGENMDDYSLAYQAPYRNGSTIEYEPDGSTITQDGSNMADYNTFCLDCHQYEVESTTTTSAHPGTPGGKLTAIDWDNEKHGKGGGDVEIGVNPPYLTGNGSLGYVLSCLDCHEPHGSPNLYLLREEANGAALSGIISNSTEFKRLCERCHGNDWQAVHHTETDKSYTEIGDCDNCHGGDPQNCGRCHFHGGTSGSHGVNQTTEGGINRRTF